MEKTDKPLTRETLVDMQVIDAKARLVGKVKDIALSVGKTGISLAVENEAGERKNISWDDVQAASDFVLLKPVPDLVVPKVEEKVAETTEQPQQKPVQAVVQKQSTQPLCPTCGRPLKWIPKYKRWYCYNDKKYV
jgi:sporulation protein YlmC with PRC-barrel domain